MSQLMQRYITAAQFFCRHVRDRQTQTYYPEAKRKSAVQIMVDNIKWMINYGEINHFYYLYGFDRKDGIDQSEYMSVREHRKLRDRENTLV
jgi:hypothetical protein